MKLVDRIESIIKTLETKSCTMLVEYTPNDSLILEILDVLKICKNNDEVMDKVMQDITREQYYRH